MQRKSKVLFRLNFLYGIFLGVILMSIGSLFFSRDFQVGVQEGFRQGLTEVAAPDKKSIIYPEISLARHAGQYNIPVPCVADSNIKIAARITQLDAVVEGNPSSVFSFLTDFLMTIGLFCYFVVVVILFLILWSIRKSVRQGDIFNRNNIKLIRAIGILIIFSALAINLARYLQIREISALMAHTDWQPVWNGINYEGIISGLLILIIGEIFAVGYDISEEQKLTI